MTCKKRVRVDKLVDKLAADGTPRPTVNAAGKITLDAFQQWIHSNCIACPACKAKGVAGLGKPRDFNLLFTTRVGPVNEAGANPSAKPQRRQGNDDDEGCSVAYLRPETAQGVYVQFNNIVTSSRARLPFGKRTPLSDQRNRIGGD